MQVNADRAAIIRQYGVRNSVLRVGLDKKLRQRESKHSLHHQFLTMRAPKECAPYSLNRTAWHRMDGLQRCADLYEVRSAGV